MGITASRFAAKVGLLVDQYYHPHSINLPFKNSSQFIACIFSDYVSCEVTWTYRFWTQQAPPEQWYLQHHYEYRRISSLVH